MVSGTRTRFTMTNSRPSSASRNARTVARSVNSPAPRAWACASMLSISVCVSLPRQLS